MLNGWGEPGSALPEEGTVDPQQRRSWTCWCAAHGPQMTAPGNLDLAGATTEAALNSNLIILEFELERDHFNPLYPPVTDETSSLSGVSSPSTDASSSGAASGGSASDSSGKTLVSTGSEGNALATLSPTEGSTPSILRSDPFSQTGDSSVSATSTTVGSSSPPPSSPNRETPPSGTQVDSIQSRTRVTVSNQLDTCANNEDEWIPSPKDIIESTTSHAKPLLALERLRRSRRATTTDTPTTPASPGGQRTATRRRQIRNRRGGGSVGMMDVFAVMAQINEQLGAAPDLEAFLNVVVGVIKDLTQFHRVLVYQFDESWNGKVMAELVDWNQTHDLYKGLHFPAADIPAQARNLYALSKCNTT